MTISVPNLNTDVVTISEDGTLVFPANKHRTAFGFQTGDRTDLLLWIGTDPSSDESEWFRIRRREDAIVSQNLLFARGVYGPVLIRRTSAGPVDITIGSSIKEEPYFIPGDPNFPRPPTITTQPDSALDVLEGEIQDFSVVAIHAEHTVNYEWYVGAVLAETYFSSASGGTTADLSVLAVVGEDTSSLYCRCYVDYGGEVGIREVNTRNVSFTIQEEVVDPDVEWIRSIPSGTIAEANAPRTVNLDAYCVEATSYTVTGDGTINGREWVSPTDAGTYSAIITAEGKGGPVDSNEFNTLIEEAGSLPVWGEIPDHSDDDTTFPYTLDLNTVCTGASFYTSSGDGDVVGSTYTFPRGELPSTYTATVQAGNDTGSVEKEWDITVVATEPTVTVPIGDRELTPGTPENIVVAADHGVTGAVLTSDASWGAKLQSDSVWLELDQIFEDVVIESNDVTLTSNTEGLYDIRCLFQPYLPQEAGQLWHQGTLNVEEEVIIDGDLLTSGNDGTWYGFDEDAYGDLQPNDQMIRRLRSSTSNLQIRMPAGHTMKRGAVITIEASGLGSVSVDRIASDYYALVNHPICTWFTEQADGTQYAVKFVELEPKEFAFACEVSPNNNTFFGYNRDPLYGALHPEGSFSQLISLRRVSIQARHDSDDFDGTGTELRVSVEGSEAILTWRPSQNYWRNDAAETVAGLIEDMDGTTGIIEMEILGGVEPVWDNIPEHIDYENNYPYTLDLDTVCEDALSYTNQGDGSVAGNIYTFPSGENPGTYTATVMAIGSGGSVPKSWDITVLADLITYNYTMTIGNSPAGIERAVGVNFRDSWGDMTPKNWGSHATREIWWLPCTGDEHGSFTNIHQLTSNDGWQTWDGADAIHVATGTEFTTLLTYRDQVGPEASSYRTEEEIADPLHAWLTARIGQDIDIAITGLYLQEHELYLTVGEEPGQARYRGYGNTYGAIYPTGIYTQIRANSTARWFMVETNSTVPAGGTLTISSRDARQWGEVVLNKHGSIDTAYYTADTTISDTFWDDMDVFDFLTLKLVPGQP